MDKPPPFKAHGKQVLRNSNGAGSYHYADAISEVAAGLIAAALNSYVVNNFRQPS